MKEKGSNFIFLTGSKKGDEKMKSILKEKRVGRGGLLSCQVEDLKRRMKNVEQIKPLFIDKGYTEEFYLNTITPRILIYGKDKVLNDFAHIIL
jgi:hypothetical protein